MYLDVLVPGGRRERQRRGEHRPGPWVETSTSTKQRKSGARPRNDAATSEQEENYASSGLIRMATVPRPWTAGLPAQALHDEGADKKKHVYACSNLERCDCIMDANGDKLFSLLLSDWEIRIGECMRGRAIRYARQPIAHHELGWCLASPRARNLTRAVHVIIESDLACSNLHVLVFGMAACLSHRAGKEGLRISR